MDYQLKQSRRKSIGLKVTAQGKVVVNAPKWMPKVVIDAFVLSKKNWIETKKQAIKNHLAKYPLPTFNNGSSHFFLGQKFELNIQKNIKNSISLNDKINIQTKSEDAIYIEKLLYKWYAQQAQILFKEELDKSFELFNNYDIEKPIIKIRRMKTMWGNCRPQTGVITLNSELIRADIKCICYVIIHELCHLVHFNHSKQFYALQNQMFPNWKVCKTLLNNDFAIRRQ